MIKKDDIKKGDFVRHTYSKTDIRIGVVESVSEHNYKNSWGVACTIDAMAGFMFFLEDLENVTVLTKEKYPEYYL